MNDERYGFDVSSHREAINNILSVINESKDDPFILKGGTALMACYGLDRFSEDIDLDSQRAKVPASRDKIRDLFDVAFIADRYYDRLDPAAKDALQRALEYKDIEQFDYLVRTQSDPLIDPDQLSERFLNSTSPVCRVVAEASIVGIIQDAPQRVWARTGGWGGISEDEFMNYFHDAASAYAIRLGSVRKLERPIPLREYASKVKAAPQSFVYIA